MGEGALKSLEGDYDAVKDISDLVTNKLTYEGNKLVYGKKRADEVLKEDEKNQEKWLKRDLTKELEDKTGYTDYRNDMEGDSLVRQDNILGQVASGVGGMVPSLVAGQALGFTPAMESTKGLTGGAKAAAIAKNVGRTYLSQLPSNILLAGQSYGGGLEEALNEGATRNQARLYGLADAAIEQGTEMMTGGVPGLEGKGGIDQFIEPLIGKANNPYARAALKTLYSSLGEGAEEYAAEMLNPLAKKIYSDEPINWDETRQRARQAFLTGALTGSILNGPMSINNFQEAGIENQIRKLDGLNEVERGALTEITLKNRRGEALTQEDMATLQFLNQKANSMNDGTTVAATQRAQQVEQALQNGQITQQQANQELQAINNVLNQTQQNEVQQANQEQNQEELPFNEEETTKKESKFKNLDEKDLNRLKQIQQKQAEGKNLTNKEKEDLNYFRRKENGVKFPELSKSDKINKADMAKYYYNADMDNFDNTMLNKAKEVVEANRQGKRTKQQWLDVAKNIGTQASNMDAESLKKYAYASFLEAKPNQGVNLNKQGQKYVGFGINEWINAVYDGAGVGKQVQETNNVAFSKQNIDRFNNQVETSLENKKSQGTTRLGKINNKIISKVKSLLGIDVTNRVHTITNNDIRHMLNEHGNPEIEAKRGQIAITENDIKKIPEILENPTDIEKGTDHKLGQTIRYIKKDNSNTTYVVEVVPDDSNSLIIKTMWKKPSTLDNSISTPILTSETQGSDISSTSAESISQSSNNVNKQSLQEQGTLREKFVYEASDNSKIDNLRKSVSQYMDNSKKTKSLVSTIEKVIKDKNYNIVFDDTIGERVNGRINIENGEVVIKLNPNSTRSGEFVLTHEITHAIDTQQMRDLVMNYAKKDAKFNDALQSLKETYGTEDISDEVLADVSGQLFGNQEFINNLSTTKPSIFKRFYNKIVSLANKITGNSNEALFIKDLRNKWETAYRKATIDTAKNNLKATKLSKELDNSSLLTNKKETNLGTYQNGLSKTDNSYKYNKVIHYDIKNGGKSDNVQVAVTKNGYIANNLLLSDNIKGKGEGTKIMLDLNQQSIEETGYPLRSLPEYNIVGTKNHTEEGKGLWDSLVRKGYAIKNEDNSYTMLKTAPTIEEHIKNKGTDNSSFSLKEKQNEIIQKSNPKDNSLGEHTWINSVDDIKTYQEALDFDEYESGNLTPDVTNKMVNEALKTGKMTVYSSYPIEQGTFVTPSKMEAQSYAGNGKVYSKEISLNDVAWIDSLQGQYAKVDSNTSTMAKDNKGRTLSPQQQEYFKDSKVRDNKGNLKAVYRGEDTIGKNTYESKKGGGNKEINEYGIYFTDSKEFADQFAFERIHTDDLFFDKKGKAGETKETYINITNPLDLGKISEKQIRELYPYESSMAKQLFDEEKFVNDMLKFQKIGNHQLMKSYLDMKDIADNTNYDGLIAKVDVQGDALEYAVFNSNQIKSVDNLNPTSNDDIRYSWQDGKWQTYLEDKYKASGTRTNLADIRLPKGVDVATTPQQVISNFQQAQKGKTDTTKLRSWVNTSNEATNNQNTLTQADKNAITYEVQSNQKTAEMARKNTDGLSYEQKVFRAENKLNSNQRVTAVDLAEAQMALLEANERGDIKTYLNLQQDIAIMGTELGQAVQAMSMIQKMSPDGQIAMLNKIVNRQQNLGNKTYEGVQLNEELVQKVLDSYDDASHTTFNKEQMDQAVDELKQDIADQMKVSKTEKINAWRYLSMLGNPKTHIRNVVANGAMTAVKRFKDTLNAAGQDIFIRDKANKTTTLKSASKDVKALADVAYNETFNKTQKGNKYNEMTELENKRKIFNNKILEAARKFNDTALTTEDQAFKKINFKKSFSKYLTAQGISTAEQINENPAIVEAAKAFALQEAKVATFNQENKLAQKIIAFDNLNPVARVVRGAIIPFARTPLNIAKTGLEYTPGAGLATTYADFKKAPTNMKGAVVVDGISKQITGTSLALLGYALAKSGILTGMGGDDKEDKFKKDQGAKMDYSIKIGDTSYDLSWLSPSAMPMFVGARMYEIIDKQEGLDENVLIESLASTLDPLSELSCISSFTKVLQSYQKGSMQMISEMSKSTAQNYISQFVPTVASQFARVFDDTKRTTNADRNSSGKFTQETMRMLQYKIPGLRNFLPESTDYFGNDRKENENILVRAWEAFLSPANTKKDTMSDESRELVRIYEVTGNDDVLPSGLQKYINYNNNKYDMSSKEYNQFKKDYGTAFQDNLKELMDSDGYKMASDDDRAEMIAGLMKYSKDKAKDNYLTEQGEDYVKTTSTGKTSLYESDKADSFTNNNFSISDYYMYKVTSPKVVTGNQETVRNKIAMTQTFGIDPQVYSDYLANVGKIKADTYPNGKTVPYSKQKKVAAYINSLPLTAQQKAILYKKQYKNYRGADRQIINAIQNSNMTAEEKYSLAAFLNIK